MSDVHHTGIRQNAPSPGGQTRPWAECEVFCVYSYAGEAGPPCGWHGMLGETLRDGAHGARRCPRCGRSTLMAIPRPPDSAR